MTVPVRNPGCEWPDCTLRAEAQVGAQWTVVDFMDYDSCAEHVDLWLERFWKMYVDGNPPVEVWWQWYL